MSSTASRDKNLEWFMQPGATITESKDATVVKSKAQRRAPKGLELPSHVFPDVQCTHNNVPLVLYMQSEARIRDFVRVHIYGSTAADAAADAVSSTEDTFNALAL